MRPSTLLVALAIVAAGCSDDDGDDPLQADEQPVLEVDTSGEPVCMLVTEDLAAEVEELPIIGCDVAHSHEIYATLEYTEEDVYPGLQALEAFAQVNCLGAFEPFVGVSAFDSSLSYTWLVPSLAGWNDDHDREVLCVLADREPTSELVGSMRGSKRTADAEQVVSTAPPTGSAPTGPAPTSATTS